MSVKEMDFRPGISNPDLFDWASLVGKLPLALWNHLRVYGKEHKNQYPVNFTTCLGIEYWRSLTGISATELEASGAYNLVSALRALIKNYDAIIDSSDSSGSLGGHFSASDFKKEKSLELASTVATALDSMRAPRKKRQELCQKITRFRLNQLEILNSQHQPSPESITFAEAIAIRESTSKQIGLVLADILNTPFDLPQQTVARIERFFSNFCIVGQTIDDLADCQIDWGGKHPNIFLAALNEHPEEKHAFSQWVGQRRKIFTFNQLAAVAPQSSNMVENYIANQSLSIPCKEMQKAVKCALHFPHGIIR